MKSFSYVVDKDREPKGRKSVWSCLEGIKWVVSGFLLVVPRWSLSSSKTAKTLGSMWRSGERVKSEVIGSSLRTVKRQFERSCL